MKKQPPAQIICDLCGKPGARVRHVSETPGKGRDLLIIQGVPMVDCPHCGEAYFTAETLHEVERLKRQRRGLAVARPVAVLSYN